MITLKSLRIISLMGLASLSPITLCMDPVQEFLRQQQAQNPGAGQADGGVSGTVLNMASGLLHAAGQAGATIVQTGIDAANAMAENSRRAANMRRAELHETIRIHERNPNHNPNDILYVNAVQELEEIARQQREVTENLNALQTGGIKTIMDMGTAGVEVFKKHGIEAAERQTKAQLAEIEAQGKVRSAAVSMQLFFNNLTLPKVAAVSAGLFGTYYGLKFGFKVLEDWYGVPELADKTTIISLHKKIYNKLMGIEIFNKTRDDIILNTELKEFMNEYIEGTKNIIAHGGHLNHVLLPGPPGTGKTLMAEVIAHELGLPSIYFAASNLLNCETEVTLVRLSQLFAYAKNSSTPIVIIMDEAEMIFGDRNKAASEKVSAIKNQIMANTGTEQSNFILIALTNRLQDFDKAFKSRFNNIVEVTPPAYAQRKQILELYVNHYIVNPTFRTKKSFLGKLFNNKTTKQITFDEKLFNPQGIEILAKKLEGFTGRNISHLVMDIRKKALACPDAHISQATIDKALAAMKIKVEEEHRDFAAGSVGK